MTNLFLYNFNFKYIGEEIWILDNLEIEVKYMILSEKIVKKQFSITKWNRGVEYYRKKRAKISDVKVVYLENEEEPAYEVRGTVQGSGGKKYSITFMACNGGVYNLACTCPDFRSYYYGNWENHNGCKHIAAATLEFIEYSNLNPIEVKTSKTVSTLITQYSEESIAKVVSKLIEEKVDLEPKLDVEMGHIRVSFRIGGKKKYVIKNLQEFYFNMKNGLKITYGKELDLIHHMNSFTEQGQKYVKFIISRIEENLLLIEQNYGGYYGRTPDKRYIILSPHSLDNLFSIMVGLEVNYSGNKIREDENNVNKVICVQDNPILKLESQQLKTENKKNDLSDFAGINLELEDIEYFQGERYSYIRKGNILYQTDENYKKVMDPFLLNMNKLRTSQIQVGKEDLGAFYRHVLGQIKDYVELAEEENSQIEQFIPPEPEFYFYLDYLNKNISCKTSIKYGDKEYDAYSQEEDDKYIRDFAKEFEITLNVRKYIPYYDDKLEINHCNKDEDLIYQFLDIGINELMSLGEVKVTDEFKRLQIKPSPKVSVGVSIESDLMNLELSASNLEFSELSDVLESYRFRKKYHRLKNGEFLRLEDNALATLTELVDGLHLSVKELTKGKMHIPAYRALYLDKVLQESEDVTYERDNQFKLLLRNFKGVEDSDYEVPKVIKATLRNYQKSGYRWLRTIDEYGFGGILADDMGLGKTLQVITLILAVKQEGKKGTSLVVCPASLVYNWESELNQFAPSLNVKTITGSINERKEILSNVENEDVIITSYDLLKRDIGLYENITFLYEIIDEAQYIKNHTTQGAKAVKIINAKTKFALTGTPIENRLSEIWSIFDYLMPGFLYGYDRFKKEIETPIAKNNDEIATARLKKMISPFIMRRLKKDVLRDLPDKIEQVTYSKLEGEQLKLYDAYVAKVKRDLETQTSEDFGKNKLKILAELTRMRQICCDPSLCYENYMGDSAKLNTCIELLQNAIEGGHKVLVFSQFTSMLSIIGEKLKAEKISYFELTGSTPKKKRLELVDQFNKDSTPIFLISLKAGGTGLNLTGADVIIHYDPWWNVAAQNQATDRAHRIGQKNVVTIFKLIAKSTIEEKILKLQESKKDLADKIISGESSNLQNMTKEEFMELL